VSSSSVGSVLITLGIGLVVVGLLVSGEGVGWFGGPPGEIRMERDPVRVYIPFASMIVISIALNLVFYIIRRFFA